MEGVAAGLMIAGEHLSNLMHEKSNASQKRKLAMSSALACFATFAGRDVMRSLAAFR